jgi:signal transduction histidine kinase
LAAGVAHEINNPIGFISSNLGALGGYFSKLEEMLQAYGSAEQAIASPELAMNLKSLREQVELDFLVEDIPILIKESKDGIARVGQIVKDLKDFSRVDSSQEWQMANLQQGMDSTLNIVANEIKYKADVVKQYSPLPEVECLPSQINQVIMNLIVNAAQAIGPERGTITLRNGVEGDNVWIEVADNGSGIPPETLQKIFDPFFTTKPIGQGTGLGLSLSYGIVKKHNGEITVRSEVGVGTTFRVELPVRQMKLAG